MTKVLGKITDIYSEKIITRRPMEGGIYMRIEAYSKVQQLYQTNKTTKSDKITKHSFSDQFEISSTGKDLQTAKQAMASTPDIRESKIAQLKNAIQGGTYQVNEENFAAKLYERYYGEMRDRKSVV